MTTPPSGEALYRIIAETASDAIITIDAQSRILSANRAVEQIFGWTPEELVGRPLVMLMPERLRGAHQQGVARYLETGRRRIPWQGAQLAGRHRSGREIALEISFGEFTGGGERIFAGIIRDITERTRQAELQDSLARAGSILVSSLDYQTTLETVARITVPQFADWCLVDVVETHPGQRAPVAPSEGTGGAGGAPRHSQLCRVATAAADPEKTRLLEVLRERFPDARPWLHLAEEALRERRALNRAYTEGELAAVSPDAEFHALARALDPASLIVLPLVSRGHALGAITLGRTSARAGFDAADLAFAEELARRAALAVDNAWLYRLAQEASEAKSNFLGAMSHELRTPLNAILGYTELLLEGIPEPIPPKAADSLGRVRTSARHLLQLIEEVLTFSRVEAGREGAFLEPTDIGRVVQDALAIIEPLATAKALPVRASVQPGMPTMETDPAKLRQILINLLANAVKFTEKGEVEVSAALEDGRLAVRVRDTGIGIPAAHHERIFDTFWQVNQRHDRRVGGTGLGLSVTRQLVTLLGGEIGVESEPGRGSTFTVLLPTKRPPRASVSGVLTETGTWKSDR